MSDSLSSEGVILRTTRRAVLKICMPKQRPWVEAFLAELTAIGPALQKLAWLLGLSGLVMFACRERLNIAVGAKARPALFAALAGTVVTGLTSALGRGEAEVLSDIFLPIAVVFAAISVFIFALMLLNPLSRNPKSLS